ncbi:MAG: hypothetical protein JXA42_14480 [Anaerolineales bacterium]|nr:hypothetical protein [Anaerolineales bacterium]
MATTHDYTRGAGLVEVYSNQAIYSIPYHSPFSSTVHLPMSAIPRKTIGSRRPLYYDEHTVSELSHHILGQNNDDQVRNL